jgi:drug/metabolite transporter (DMT)-like permease
MLTRRQAGLLVVLTLLWGVNWPMMKFSLREITPLWFRAITMSGGVLVLTAFFLWRGSRLALPRGHWLAIVWLALPNIVGWHLFSIVGLQALASGRAAILGFTMPVWTVLLGLLLDGGRLTRRTSLAVVFAIAAVGLLSAHELSALAGKPVGVLWMQLAAASWAAGTLAMRRTQLPMPTEAVTIWMMAVGSAFFWLAAPLFEPVPKFAAFSTPMWWSLAYGVLLNFGYAQVIWFSLARELPPSASAFSIMAVPLVGIAGAAAIVGEVPRSLDLLAALCVAAAIAATLLPARRPPGA